MKFQVLSGAAPMGHRTEAGRWGKAFKRKDPAVAPAPDSNPGRIDVREPANRAGRGRLIVGLDDAHLFVDDLAPRAPPRARPAIVHARDDVAVLREHLIPQIVRTAPAVRHRLRTRAAVDTEEHRIACGGIEIRRSDEPGVELDAVADVDFPELG